MEISQRPVASPLPTKPHLPNSATPPPYAPHPCFPRWKHVWCSPALASLPSLPTQEVRCDSVPSQGPPRRSPTTFIPYQRPPTRSPETPSPYQRPPNPHLGSALQGPSLTPPGWSSPTSNSRLHPPHPHDLFNSLRYPDTWSTQQALPLEPSLETHDCGSPCPPSLLPYK